MVQARGPSHCFTNGATAMQDKQKTAGFLVLLLLCLHFNIAYSE